MKNILFILLAIILSSSVKSQDTTIVQTLTFDSLGRDYMFTFPADTGQTYEKIYMQYTMRCKNGLVSTQGAPNDHGCGEWDYSCNTFIVDSSLTDSIKATHDSYIISDFSGTSFPYTTLPTYTYTQYSQYNMVYNSVISETTANIGTGTENLDFPFAAANKTAKSQFLFTANELSSAGLVAGDITGLKLNVLTVGDDANFLRIKIKQTSQNQLSDTMPETSGFTEVYFKNTHLTTGINQFNFYNNFNWDGTSNLIIEFSFTNSATGTNTIIEGENTGLNIALVSNSQNSFLDFFDNGAVDISNSNYSSVDKEVSVEFWAYGNSGILPVNTSAFEARDNQNRRQVHAHLPWGNSNIYWDCGNDGSYDRIYKAATQSEMSGQWNHWAFTKNANTGDMKIYLNGQLWHSGTGKTKSIDIDVFKFGSNSDPVYHYPYYGHIDDFSVWDKELTQSEIQNWMYRDINSNHPEYSHLLNYFNLDAGSGSIITDNSPNNVSATHTGTPAWKNYRGNEIFKNFSISTYRPNVTFVQGTYNFTIDTILTLDSVENNKNTVYSYQVSGTDLQAVDTNSYYMAGYSYIYDESGNIIDSVFFAAQDTINITTLTYYKKYPMQFELMSFVTPYGLYLDLGQEGKMWQFDVTDFKPVLTGCKRLYVGNGGQYQEDLDIKFIFISGIPPREPKKIQQIWRPGRSLSYTSIIANSVTEPRDIKLDSTAASFKIRTAITGHGQQGEFIPRTHYINIDGGANELQWQVWKECADNPIYPQGGTWVYDRAGWCPGAPTDMRELEIDSATGGQTINVDYGLTSASGTSNYLVNCQLVSYGQANFTQDAELVEVKYPSKKVKYSRLNPICYDPKITIRNTGITPLTSLTVTYNVTGGDTLVYNWTGNLDFMEKTDVTLPIDSASFWVGSQNVFNVSISNPNGGQDEYANNNTIHSEFNLPDVYTGKVYLSLLTNNYAYENSYTVKDMYGNVVLSRSGMSNNSYYYDTIPFDEGCFTLDFEDSGNDGLDFWANSAQGSGALRLKSAENGYTLKIFDSDFGKNIFYAFSVTKDNTKINNTSVKDNFIKVYPNPSKGNVKVKFSFDKKIKANISVFDLTGRKVYSKNIDSTNNLIDINLSDKKEGVYYLRFKSEEYLQTQKIIIAK